jgi:DNA polymerase elongation subunit (family B)
MSSAMKIVVNSAYGYLGATSLTRLADVSAANEITRHGRETLALMCRALAERGVTLLEADTDGVYFAVPPAWGEADERRVVAEVAALLPRLVQLEFEGRYAAMLSHEPKNYALLGHDGSLLLRGVAFRSSRSEPYGDRFLRQALKRLLIGDVSGVRDAYLATIGALRARALPTHDVASRVRLTKSPHEYREVREKRRELPYEALLASRRRSWSVGDRVHVYRRRNGEPGLAAPSVEESTTADLRDYDVEYYVRLLRTTYAERMARAFTAEDFGVVFADPDQYALFAPPVAAVRTVLVRTTDEA